MTMRPSALDKNQRGTPDSGAPSARAVPLVVLGASAGGVEAMTRVLDALRPDLDACFVAILHLDPSRASAAAALLERHTAMPVVQVESATPALPGRLHVIAPGTTLSLLGGVLHAEPEPRATGSFPLNAFLRSAVEERGQAVTAVILSGAGSDGARGAALVCDAGGRVIVQDPASAQFDGMPRSAIDAGVVDEVVELDAMGAAIARAILPPPTLTDLERDGEELVDRILRLLGRHGGVHFEDYKPATIRRRIERRMAIRHVSSLEDYLGLLQAERDELQTLRRELLIGVTRFFRDPDSFDDLRRLVIEPLVEQRRDGEPIRVWCAGVATGEEAYSVVMAFSEAFAARRRWPALKVFATDVDPVSVEFGAAGVFPESISTEVPPGLLERYFSHRDGRWVVGPELRQPVVFARHNLLVDPPFTRMDLVVCRNTLIYFRGGPQERVLRRLHYALVPGGTLFLGPSEALGVVQADFSTLSARHKIWRSARAPAAPSEIALRPPSTGGRRVVQVSQGHPAVPSAADLGLAALSRSFGPPAVLVGPTNELIHAYGDTTRFIAMRPGEASLDVIRLLAEPLAATAATLLFSVARDGEAAVAHPLTLPSAHGEPALGVRLSAWPAGEHDGQSLRVLAFESLEPGTYTAAAREVALSAEQAERVHALEAELSGARATLLRAVEELEAANEELHATNEELKASNEELQSSNEELQSLNQELNLVNHEYQQKIEALNRANADLDGLMRVVSVGTVFVDHRLRLTRFSPDVQKIFGVRDSDVGRPIAELDHVLDYPELLDDLQHAVDWSVASERDVKAVEGRFYRVKILPYHVRSSSEVGAVVSFHESTTAHHAQRLQAILDGLAEHVVVLDAHGMIRFVNKAWAEFSDLNGAPDMRRCGPGTNYLRASVTDPGAPDAHFASRAAAGIRDVLQGIRHEFTMEYPCHAPSQQRWFVMHVRPLREAGGGAVVSHVNVTPWMRSPLAVTGESQGGADRE